MGINQESASKEIETSLTNVMDIVLKADDNCAKVEIFLLDSFNIPFSLIANGELLTRSTYIFDYARRHRGQYLLFKSSDLEYKSIQDYFDVLIKNAYEFDMSPQTCFSDVVKQKYIHDEFAYKEKGLKTKKIHPIQLDNLVRSSFNKQNKANRETDNQNFSMIPYDDTQRVLFNANNLRDYVSCTSVKSYLISGVQPKLFEMPFGISNNFNRVSKG